LTGDRRLRERMRSMPQMLADDIRSQVVTNELAPGQALPSEKELIETYGVSRPTLREAIRILEAESLVETRRGSKGGVIVRVPDADVVIRQAAVLLQLSGATMRDVYGCQMALEPAAVRVLAAKRTKADLDALRAIIEEGHACLETDPITFGSVAGRFHRAVVHLSGSATMSFIVDMLASITDASYHVKVERLAAKARVVKIRRSLASWSHLVSLIEAHDVDGAQQQWVKHLKTVGANVDDTVALVAHVATAEARLNQDSSVSRRTRAIS
jgi:GntR family transcriptional regulator, transcriptional repressor for pyruvate dehydrogenase complex